MANVPIGAPALGKRITRVLRSLIAAVPRIVQSRVLVNGFSEGIIGAKKKAPLETLAKSERAGLIARVEAERVILDVSISRIGPRIASAGQGVVGEADQLVDIVFASQMRAFRSRVAHINRDASSEF